jgi:hypothetical protein
LHAFDHRSAALRDAEERRDRDAEVADRTRRERAEITLLARLAAHRGRPVRLRLRAGLAVEGQVADLGRDWVLVRLDPSPREALVPLGAVTAIGGLAAGSAAAGSARRFGLGLALRALSRDRAVVRLTDVDGATRTGTIDSVGADALDLAEHPVEVPRRSADVRGVWTVPLAALVVVESRAAQ